MTATLNMETELTRLREENNTMNALLLERKRRIELSRMLESVHPERDEIVFKVGAAFDLSYEQFFTKCREERIVIPRQLAMMLMYELCGIPLIQVGKYFAKDHGTILHAIRATKARIDTDAKFKAKVASIRAQLAQKEGM